MSKITYNLIIITVITSFGWCSAVELPKINPSQMGMEAIVMDNPNGNWNNVHPEIWARVFPERITFVTDKVKAEQVISEMDIIYNKYYITDYTRPSNNYRVLGINGKIVLVYVTDIFRRYTPEKDLNGTMDKNGNVVVYRRDGDNKLHYQSTCLYFIGDRAYVINGLSIRPMDWNEINREALKKSAQQGDAPESASPAR